jgi:ribosome-associated translation inhibitor RaiA
VKISPSNGKRAKPLMEATMTVTDLVLEPQVYIHGEVTPEVESYARRKVLAALQHAPAPVLRIRLTLDATAHGDRIDVQVDVNGAGVHAHAVGETMPEAVDLLQERLRSQLRHLRRRPAQGPRPRPA